MRRVCAGVFVPFESRKDRRWHCFSRLLQEPRGAATRTPHQHYDFKGIILAPRLLGTSVRMGPRVDRDRAASRGLASCCRRCPAKSASSPFASRWHPSAPLLNLRPLVLPLWGASSQLRVEAIDRSAGHPAESRESGRRRGIERKHRAHARCLVALYAHAPGCIACRRVAVRICARPRGKPSHRCAPFPLSLPAFCPLIRRSGLVAARSSTSALAC